jgi:NADH:ubiquinone oxidoreductase subunit 6 (subunit J)
VQRSILSSGWLVGIGVAVAVFAVLYWAIAKSALNQPQVPPRPEATVKQIGEALMTWFVLPLEVVGLLLTVALIGAVIIAMKEQESGNRSRKPEPDEKVKAAASIVNRKS